MARDLRVRPSPRHAPPGVEGPARSAHHDEHAVGHGALRSPRSACAVSPAPKLPPRSLPIDGGGDAQQHPVRSPSRHRAARPREERCGGRLRLRASEHLGLARGAGREAVPPGPKPGAVEDACTRRDFDLAGAAPAAASRWDRRRCTPSTPRCCFSVSLHNEGVHRRSM